MRRHALAALALALAPALLAPTLPAHAQSAPAGADDFARAAAQSNLGEVLLATLALQKTHDKRVQDDAWTMLDHHARAMGDLAEALSPGAAVLPTEAGAEQRAALQRMRGLAGTQFDQAYFAYQTEAHGRAVTLYEQGSRLPDEKLARYARITLPVLRAHREITQIRSSQPPEPMPGQ